MIALEIQLNGQRLCLAGAEDLTVLNASVGALGLLGLARRSQLVPETREMAAQKRPYFDLHVGGLTNRGPGVDDSHLDWCKDVNIGVGDTVSVRIVDVDPTAADRPVKERSRGGSTSDQNEKQLFERSKQIYLALREKYGDGAV